MRRLPFLLLIVVACSRQAEIAPTDTREPVDMAYVTAPEMRVHTKPDDTSPLVLTYQNGESVAIMAKRGEWVEVRTGDRTGWGHAGDLGTGAEAKKQEESPQVRFRLFPAPVTNTTAHGEIYFQADVNTDGDVVAVHVLENTTGNDALGAQNAAALRAAKFYPIVKNGERKPFQYYHRVQY
ncbi:MAG TPA: SH3 domain-containing protein [Thermoanaerobaculia bacterium]|nr:SH3 domain-containing protein [Thermoanaerobaculia bacterium]